MTSEIPNGVGRAGRRRLSDCAGACCVPPSTAAEYCLSARCAAVTLRKRRVRKPCMSQGGEAGLDTVPSQLSSTMTIIIPNPDQQPHVP
jgi:hypothetical protein